MLLIKYVLLPAPSEETQYTLVMLQEKWLQNVERVGLAEDRDQLRVLPNTATESEEMWDFHFQKYVRNFMRFVIHK